MFELDEPYVDEKETKYLKWIQLKQPLTVQILGTSGEGIIIKPFPPKKEEMNEEESTGI